MFLELYGNRGRNGVVNNRTFFDNFYNFYRGTYFIIIRILSPNYVLICLGIFVWLMRWFSFVFFNFNVYFLVCTTPINHPRYAKGMFSFSLGGLPPFKILLAKLYYYYTYLQKLQKIHKIICHSKKISEIKLCTSVMIENKIYFLVIMQKNISFLAYNCYASESSLYKNRTETEQKPNTSTPVKPNRPNKNRT